MASLDGLKEYLIRYETLLKDKKQGKDEFVAEFQKIKKESELLLREGKVVSGEGAKEHNKKKNRYKDILPFDHSRVILNDGKTKEGSDFINANYVKSPEGRKGYIASQGPLPTTVNDFWRMIWQHKIKVIVMACKEIELGKHRCQKYWPLEEEHLTFGKIEVTLVNQRLLADNLTERKIRATLGKEEVVLHQIHYSAWPDHGAPKSSSDIIRLVEIMRDIHPWDDPPVLVHCSAGCGRTGAIVAIDYGKRLIKKAPEQFSVYEIVVMLRKQRPAMVQSKEQYEYLYEVFKDLIVQRIKASESKPETASYVNIEFTPKEELQIYENFDSSPRTSPKPLRKARPVPVPGGPTQGIIVRGNLGEPRKPLITSNARLPQQATIRNDSHHPQLPPKTASKQTNLLDSNHVNSNALPSPLEPVALNTVEMRKPTADKEWIPQNYVNVSIGAPKVPKKISPAGDRPPVSSKKPSHHEKSLSLGRGVKPDEISRPLNKTRSFETLIEDTKVDLSPPDLPAKPSNGKKNIPKHGGGHFGISKSSEDLVDGARPPLPLKHKDILEFESPLKTDRPESEADRLRGAAKREAGLGSAFVNKSALSYQPDNINNFKSTSCIKSKPEAQPGSHNNNNDLLGNFKIENPRSQNVTAFGGNDGITEKWMQPNVLEINGKHKDLGKQELTREPKKPSSDIPIRSKTDNLKLFPTKRSDEAYNLPETMPQRIKVTSTSSREVPKKAMTLPREGLGLGTNQVSDGLVGRTKYNVTIEKAEPKQEQASGPRPSRGLAVAEKPVLAKHSSANAILVESRTQEHESSSRIRTNKNPFPTSSNQNTETSANHNPRTGPLRLDLDREAKSNGAHDQADLSALYAKVQKPSTKPKEESFYESIWSPKKSPVHIDDGPPTLPARTADSFVVLDQNHFGEKRRNNHQSTSDSEDGVTPTEDSPPSASSDHWLSVGVDKLRKKLSPKAAFSAAARTTRQLSSSSGATSSTFFTQTSNTGNSAATLSPASTNAPNLKFGNRMPQKPKGPRPMPRHWPTIKPASSTR